MDIFFILIELNIVSHFKQMDLTSQSFDLHIVTSRKTCFYNIKMKVIELT